MSVLILVRHGQASFGAAHYDQLSDTGREQARHTGRWLSERYPGGRDPQGGFSVLSGPRNRHLETATEILAAAGRPGRPERLAALDEFAEGEEILAAATALFGRPMHGEGAPHRAEQLRCYAEAYQAWAHGDLAIPGRASFAVFREGVGQWLRQLVAETPSGQRIVAVTSAGVIAAAVCETLGLSNTQWLSMVGLTHNTGLSEIVFSPGRINLRSFNGAGHLPAGLASSI